jgi:hypothetical protein
MRKIVGLINSVEKGLEAFRWGLGQVTILGEETSILDISSSTLDEFSNAIFRLDKCIKDVSNVLGRKQQREDIKNKGAEA